MNGIITPPLCHCCVAEEIRRIAASKGADGEFLLPTADRSILFDMAAHERKHGGCIHLAISSECKDRSPGLWLFTACGKNPEHDDYSRCAKLEHVTCALCQAKAVKRGLGAREKER